MHWNQEGHSQAIPINIRFKVNPFMPGVPKNAHINYKISYCLEHLSENI